MSGRTFKETHVIHSHNTHRPGPDQQPAVRFQAVTIQPESSLIVTPPTTGAVTSDILTQMEAGIPPTNEQIQEVIDTTSGFLAKEQLDTNLSGRTRKTVADVNTVLKDTKEFMNEKNPDETLQNLYVHGQLAAENIAAKSGTTARDRQLGNNISEIVDHAGNLARVLVRSNEFRNLLFDFTELIQKLIFDVSQKGDLSSSNMSSTPLSGTEIEYEKIHPSPTERILVPSNALPTTTPSSNSSSLHESLSSSPSNTVRQWSSFTVDEKKRFRTHLSRILIRINNNEEFTRSLQDLIHLGGCLKTEVNEVIYNKAPSMDATMKQIMYEAKIFLERFSGEQTIDQFISEVRSFMKLILDDPLLNRYFDELNDFFSQLIERPHSIVEEGALSRKIDDLAGRGLDLLAGLQQHPYLSNIFSEGKDILSAIRDDPVRQKLSADMAVLASDFITYNREGKPVLNTELVAQLKTLMVPLLTEHLRDIPVPKIVGSNETYDYWVDNITFTGGDLIPDQMHIHVDADTDVDIKSLSTRKTVTKILLTASGIKTKMRDIQFWFRRKSFPRTEDQGFATVEVDGASLLIQLTFSAERFLPFDVHAARFKVNELRVHISETKHDWLYNMFTSFYRTSIKERIEDEVQRKLRAVIFKMNHQMNLLFTNATEGVPSFATNLLFPDTGKSKGTESPSTTSLTGVTNLLSR